jgi:cellulose synthase operon protein C
MSDRTLCRPVLWMLSVALACSAHVAWAQKFEVAASTSDPRALFMPTQPQGDLSPPNSSVGSGTRPAPSTSPSSASPNAAPAAAPAQSAAPSGPPTAEQEAAIAGARRLAMAEPSNEYATRLLMEALSQAGRKKEAIAEADDFMARIKPTSLLLAQRGFLRRELGDVKGAGADFAAALSSEGLSLEQTATLKAAALEAQITEGQDAADRALANAEYLGAIEHARNVLQLKPDSEAAALVVINALSRSGKKREALGEVAKLIASRPDNLSLVAQRGFLNRELGDTQVAIADFNLALRSSALTPDQRRNLEAAIEEAQYAEWQAELNRAETALDNKEFKKALELAAEILQRDPKSEAAVRIRVSALSQTKRKREALAEADRFIDANGATALLAAQRGYLRREMRNLRGAMEDFTASLKSTALTPEQRHNINRAIEETKYTASRPPSQVMRSAKLDALIRAGRTQEAIAEADRLIATGYTKGWVYAQRGFARRSIDDLPGAVSDFDMALSKGDLDAKVRTNIAYGRTEALARWAEKDGRTDDAIEAYRAFTVMEPRSSDAWYSYGYAMIKKGRKVEGADALRVGLQQRPNGRVAIDAANAYVLTNAPLASQLFRLAIDLDTGGGGIERERLRNEVVNADASVQTTIGYGGIGSRPAASGGRNDVFAAETRVRFDGRYLAAVPGLEFVARGQTSKDEVGQRETELGAGLRFRPFRDVDFYVGLLADHFFKPTSRTEALPIWGLSLGTNPYPYIPGWIPYWDFGAFGAYRTAEGQLLQDVRGNVGFMYQFNNGAQRFSIGPTLLAVASYDNKATHETAFGIGPSVLSRFWLGGDRYRSYDAILTLQVGYLTNIGNDERLKGWRGQIGLTF